jgi:PPOX class probable F420-dependent enzyme
VTPDVALAFVASNHRAVLATRRRSDGAPQMSPVTVGVDDSGHVVVSSRETAMKVRNLRSDPRAWLVVMNDGFFGAWVQIEGPVEIVELPEAMELLVDYYRRISGEHPDWDDYRAAMERDQRVIVRITPERVGPSVQG